ncbi:Uncharacterized protein Fot_07061 [Forsythia ovata]|uniref:Uncharacterized protein n=1 Tax=Forsythia ovata TaxID=205694 RepID=A0ABD1WV32_9LAMI
MASLVETSIPAQSGKAKSMPGANHPADKEGDWDLKTPQINPTLSDYTRVGTDNVGSCGVAVLLEGEHKDQLQTRGVTNVNQLHRIDFPTWFHTKVGVKTKTTEVQSKLANVTLVDANKNQGAFSLQESCVILFCCIETGEIPDDTTVTSASRTIITP